MKAKIKLNQLLCLYIKYLKCRETRCVRKVHKVLNEHSKRKNIKYLPEKWKIIEKWELETPV